MRAKDLMTKKIITAFKEDSIKSVIEKMKNNDIGLVPIVSENKKIQGVITDRDIALKLANISVETSISDIMNCEFVSANPDDDIETIARMMKEYQLHRILILENNEVVGIISIADLAINKETNKLINDIVRDISMPNPQKEKPLKYLKVDDFRL